MFQHVGIPEPERRLSVYPHQLSGGLKQRVMIAMAIAGRPHLLIADEPTTALDVTIQAQILKLLKDLQSELGMAVLLITHDLGVVANMAEEVVVMYHGEVMERGTLEAIFRRAAHPYLKALLHAVPRFHMKPGERLKPIREIKHQPGGQLLAAKDAWPEGAESAGPLLEVSGLSKSFSIRKSGLFASQADGRVVAVDDVSFSIRRSEIEPISATPRARQSAARAIGSPWKLPPDSTAPSSGNTNGLSVTEFISIASLASASDSRSRAAPCTWGMQRTEYGSWIRRSPTRCDSRIPDPCSSRQRLAALSRWPA